MPLYKGIYLMQESFILAIDKPGCRVFLAYKTWDPQSLYQDNDANGDSGYISNVSLYVRHLGYLECFFSFQQSIQPPLSLCCSGHQVDKYCKISSVGVYDLSDCDGSVLCGSVYYC